MSQPAMVSFYSARIIFFHPFGSYTELSITLGLFFKASLKFRDLLFSNLQVQLDKFYFLHIYIYMHSCMFICIYIFFLYVSFRFKVFFFKFSEPLPSTFFAALVRYAISFVKSSLFCCTKSF